MNSCERYDKDFKVGFAAAASQLHHYKRDDREEGSLIESIRQYSSVRVRINDIHAVRSETKFMNSILRVNDRHRRSVSDCGSNSAQRANSSPRWQIDARATLKAEREETFICTERGAVLFIILQNIVFSF